MKPSFKKPGFKKEKSSKISRPSKNNYNNGSCGSGSNSNSFGSSYNGSNSSRVGGGGLLFIFSLPPWKKGGKVFSSRKLACCFDRAPTESRYLTHLIHSSRSYSQLAKAAWMLLRATVAVVVVLLSLELCRHWVSHSLWLLSPLLKKASTVCSHLVITSDRHME